MKYCVTLIFVDAELEMELLLARELATRLEKEMDEAQKMERKTTTELKRKYHDNVCPSSLILSIFNMPS